MYIVTQTWSSYVTYRILILTGMLVTVGNLIWICFVGHFQPCKILFLMYNRTADNVQNCNISSPSVSHYYFLTVWRIPHLSKDNAFLGVGGLSVSILSASQIFLWYLSATKARTFMFSRQACSRTFIQCSETPPRSSNTFSALLNWSSKPDSSCGQEGLCTSTPNVPVASFP